MKIYNQKGVVFGLIWTILGGWILISAIIAPNVSLIKQVKAIIPSVIVLSTGLTSVSRSFSKKATIEDEVERNDERNKLIQLKTKARMLDFILGAIGFLMIVGLIGWIVTQNIVWAFLFFWPCVLLTLYYISYIIVNNYYEKHE